MATIKQTHTSALQEGYLDTKGENKNGYQPMNLEGLEAAITILAGEFVKKAQQELDKAGTTGTGFLADSIDPQKAVVKGSKVSVAIAAAKYFDFVNKGVSGSKSGGSGPYKFKNPFPNKKMAAALEAWGRDNMSKVRVKETIKPYKNIERKNDKVKKAIDDVTKLKQWSYWKATAIKQWGLPATHFWDKAKQHAEDKAAEILGEGIKADIIAAIKSDLVSK